VTKRQQYWKNLNVPDYVALMRGVAPSTPPRNNASIMQALGTLSFTSLAPVLSSGNYVFTADPASNDDLATSIEAALLKELGVPIMTIVRRRDQLQTLVDKNPLAGVPHGPETYHLVTLFRQPVDVGFELPHQPDGKSFQLVAYIEDALFTLSDNRPNQNGGQSDSASLMTWLERRYGPNLTSRTSLTLQKVLKKMTDLSGADISSR